MAGSKLIALWLISLALLAGACSVALAQGTDTVYDEAGVLTNSEEHKVQEAREAGVPRDAGVIMVAPRDRWDVAANLNGVSEDAVSNAMEPDFADGNFAAGLIAGADEIKGEPAASQDNPEGGAGGVLGG